MIKNIANVFHCNIPK